MDLRRFTDSFEANLVWRNVTCNLEDTSKTAGGSILEEPSLPTGSHSPSSLQLNTDLNVLKVQDEDHNLRYVMEANR